MQWYSRTVWVWENIYKSVFFIVNMSRIVTMKKTEIKKYLHMIAELFATIFHSSFQAEIVDANLGQKRWKYFNS